MIIGLPVITTILAHSHICPGMFFNPHLQIKHMVVIHGSLMQICFCFVAQRAICFVSCLFVLGSSSWIWDNCCKYNYNIFFSTYVEIIYLASLLQNNNALPLLHRIPLKSNMEESLERVEVIAYLRAKTGNKKNTSCLCLKVTRHKMLVHILEKNGSIEWVGLFCFGLDFVTPIFYYFFNLTELSLSFRNVNLNLHTKRQSI